MTLNVTISTHTVLTFIYNSIGIIIILILLPLASVSRISMWLQHKYCEQNFEFGISYNIIRKGPYECLWPIGCVG